MLMYFLYMLINRLHMLLNMVTNIISSSCLYWLSSSLIDQLVRFNQLSINYFLGLQALGFGGPQAPGLLKVSFSASPGAPGIPWGLRASSCTIQTNIRTGCQRMCDGSCIGCVKLPLEWSLWGSEASMKPHGADFPWRPRARPKAD